MSLFHEPKSVAPTIEPQEHRIAYLITFDNAEPIIGEHARVNVLRFLTPQLELSLHHKFKIPSSLSRHQSIELVRVIKIET